MRFGQDIIQCLESQSRALKVCSMVTDDVQLANSMAYYLSLFSPETYEAFAASDRSVQGFRERHENAAGKLQVGDKLLCYMTKLSRWCGVAEVASSWFRDDTPRFQETQDPYVIRFKVTAVSWLPTEKAIPIHDQRVWRSLSFTSGFEPKSSRWTGKIRTSLTRIEDADGRFLEQFILAQAANGEVFQFDQGEYEKYFLPKVHAHEGIVSVSVPAEADDEAETGPGSQDAVRESIKVQSQLARIGAEMGMQIWIPRSDRGRVLREWPDGEPHMLTALPLNYNEATIQTIEQIDVLWLKKRTIIRAFEVEHSTAVYSGILRMADLLALQPNLNIKLHIVAPIERKDKVFRELRRPVFSLLDSGPLAETCRFLSYDSVAEINSQKLLSHLSDSVLEEYAEEAD